MPRTVMIWNHPLLKVADDQAGLAAGTAYECQVTSAMANVAVNFSTVPATGCEGPSQSPSGSTWSLDLGWLQDWTAALGGLSGWALNHEGERAWILLQPDADDVTVSLEGEVFVVPGPMGATFGDGSAAIATATWPFVNKPAFTFPQVLAAELEGAETAEHVAA